MQFGEKCFKWKKSYTEEEYTSFLSNGISTKMAYLLRIIQANTYNYKSHFEWLLWNR